MHGGLGTYLSALDAPYFMIPHDCVVPGAVAAGDIPALAAAVAPRPLLLDGLVDNLNRRMSVKDVRKAYTPAAAAYKSAGAKEAFSVEVSSGTTAKWLQGTLRGE